MPLSILLSNNLIGAIGLKAKACDEIVPVSCSVLWGKTIALPSIRAGFLSLPHCATCRTACKEMPPFLSHSSSSSSRLRMSGKPFS